MYEDAASEIKKILKLVEACPETLQAKAFEVLLNGYVQSLSPGPRQMSLGGGKGDQKLHMPAVNAPPSGIPQEVLPRLQAMAKRRNVDLDCLAGLFDFSSDPVAFAPVHIEGSKTLERMRKVALAVAARTFILTGKWTADWTEIKAMCTHQNCYDQPNFASTLKKEKGEIFKSVEVGKSIELSASGTDQAELLLASLVEINASNK